MEPTVPANLSNPVIPAVLLVLAGVAVYLCVQAVVVWLSRPGEKLYLVFAGWSLSSLMYLGGQYYQYRAPDLHGAVVGARVNISAGFLIAAFVLVCVTNLTGDTSARVFRVAGCVTAVTLAVCAVALPGSVVSEDVRLVHSPFGHVWVSPQPGPLFYAYFPLIAAVLVTLFRSVIRAQSRLGRLESGVLLLALGFYTVSGLNDVLVSVDAYPGLTVFEYAGVLMVVLVDFVLVRRRKRLHEEVQDVRAAIDRERRTDVVTGLPNRREFERVLLRGVAAGGHAGGALDARSEAAATLPAASAPRVAVALLDVARFKTVNEMAGHAFGDDVLRAAAERLEDVTSGVPGSVVARAEGDRFLLLVPSAPSESARETVHLVLEDVFDAFAAPLVVEGERLVIGFRAGYDVGVPADRETVGDMLKHADAALAQARRRGMPAVEAYSEETLRAAAHVARLEADLRSAVPGGQLFVVYQPKVDIRSGEPYGCEALLRWTHPELGPVSPGEFIPVAEEAGLIHELGSWVIEEALTQAARWEALAATRGQRPISVSVNVSRAQVTRPDFYEEIEGALSATGVSPSLVELELTETSVMENRNAAVGLLGRLRSLGVRVSLDDFGTGYSSLACLADLPIDVVKLDRAFIDGLPEDGDSRFLTNMVIALGRHKGIKVVAEGIETEAQRRYLAGAGCELGQGWFFGRPVGAGELTRAVFGAAHPAETARAAASGE